MGKELRNLNMKMQRNVYHRIPTVSSYFQRFVYVVLEREGETERSYIFWYIPRL